VTLKRFLLSFILLISVLAVCQTRAPGPSIELASEPHHTLLLQNSKVRVYRLKLKPHEATLPHWHRKFYAYLSLSPAVIGNEVRGRKPVMSHTDGDEVHISKGGFIVAERNESSETVELLVVEPLSATAGTFDSPVKSIDYHDAVLGELFDTPVVRGYEMRIAAGGNTSLNEKDCDRLLIAISDLELQDEFTDKLLAVVSMAVGEIHWIPRGVTHVITNIGQSPATFVTVEFK
jgi:hypothetical protein